MNKPTNRHARRAGARHYELTNHLGNVLAVIADRIDRSTNRPELLQSQAYEPFGRTLANTAFFKNANNKYRFGFNGKENIEVGSSWQDFGARLYDRRLGRWMSCDPLQDKYPSLTPYNFVANSPTMLVDPDGNRIIAINQASKQIIRQVINTTFFGNQAVYNLFSFNGNTLTIKSSSEIESARSSLNAGQKNLLDQWTEIIRMNPTIYFGYLANNNVNSFCGSNSYLSQNGFSAADNEITQYNNQPSPPITLFSGSHVLGNDDKSIFAFVSGTDNNSNYFNLTTRTFLQFASSIEERFYHEVFGEAYMRIILHKTNYKSYRDVEFGTQWLKIKPIQWENQYLSAIGSQLRSTGEAHVRSGVPLDFWYNRNSSFILGRSNTENSRAAVKCPRP